jgi:hypothetical protein
MPYMAKVPQILQFIRAIVRHWGALVTGGALIGIVGIWQGTGHAVSPTIYWVVAILGIIGACYLAWNEERDAKTKAISERDEARKEIVDLKAKLSFQRPDFFLETGSGTAMYDDKSGLTIAYIRLNVTNRGADSVAVGWTAEYQNDKGREPAEVRNLFPRQAFLPVGEGRNVQVTNDDLITTKTMNPISRGSCVPGRIAVTVQGNKVEELTDGRGLFVFTCQDYLGEKYSVEAKRRERQSIPKFSPDEKLYYDTPDGQL